MNLCLLEERNKILVTYRQIQLKRVSDLLDSALVEKNSEGHYESDNMKETVVPQKQNVYSLYKPRYISVSNRTGEPCDIA
jgi:hypothetical protein